MSRIPLSFTDSSTGDEALGPLAGLVNNAGVTGAAVTTDKREAEG